MSDKALGLIETKGLVGAIEASDAAVKAAAVVISSAELTEAAFMTLRIEGDLGAVQAAVEAGSQAAEKIGELVSVHIIPNPDKGLSAILPKKRYISKYHPDENRPPLDLDGSEPDLPVKPKPPSPKPIVSEKKKDSDKYSTKDFENMTVSELRQIARSLVRISLKGREISMANKQQLIDAIRRVKDMD